MNPPDPHLQIVGLGMATVDVLVRLEHMPTWQYGVHLDGLTLDGGGPIGTSMTAAARLGAAVGVITPTGNDEVATLKLHLLHKEGVDTRCCPTRPCPERQIILVCVNSHDGERVFSFPPDTEADLLQPAELDQDYITQADILHLDGYCLEAALQAARWMRAAGKQVSLDVAKTDGEISASLRELLGLCTVVISGEGFSRSLTGIDDVARAGRRVLELGPQVFVETLGDQGSITVSAEGNFFCPAYPVPVIDTTGAGDVFHGAYLIGWLKGWDLRRIAEFASATAALKCTRLGGRKGIPSYAEVLHFLDAHQPDFKETTCHSYPSRMN